MDYASAMQQIFECTRQFSCIQRELPTLIEKDLSNYGLGKYVSFQLRLDPSKDNVPWKQYNVDKPFINVWLHDNDMDCPRFEVGYGPVYFDMNDKGDIMEALLITLKSIRDTHTSDESNSESDDA